MSSLDLSCIEVGKSRQPWAIFQFQFFFRQVDNKKSRIKYSSIAV